MQPSTVTILSLLLAVLLIPTASATTFNITKILNKHPGFSTFNEYLTKTHLANEINQRQTITVLALDNDAMSSLISQGFSLYTMKNILSLHVLTDYYGAKKLHEITDDTTLTASLFQSSGEADGNSGYVNITDLHKGKVGFGPADSSGALKSMFVKSVLEMPYKLSIIQISQALDSQTAEAPTPEPSKINVTSVLEDRGCKGFAHWLVSTGAEKTYQENTESGLTVFCPSDGAIKAFMPKFKNLTDANKTALVLYHAVAIYNSMGSLKSNNGVINTLATEGSNSKKKYEFTVQNDGESVTLKTKVVTAKITSVIVDQDPFAAFKLDKVLQPPELFKPSIVDAPAEAPAADAPGPAADGPSYDDDQVADDTSSHKKRKNSASKINGGGLFVAGLALCYAVLTFL